MLYGMSPHVLRPTSQRLMASFEHFARTILATPVVAVPLTWPSWCLGQVANTIPSEITCPACEVTFSSTVRLQGAEGSEGGLPGRARLVVQGDDGQFFVVYDGRLDVVYVHRPDGTFSHSIPQAAGKNPSPVSIGTIQIDGENHVHIFDRALARRFEVHAETGVVIRSDELPDGVAGGIPVGTRLLVTGPLSLRQTAGFPLHILTTDGTWERSFGLDEPVLRPDLGSLMVRTLTNVTDSTFWSAPPNEYRLERWGLDGGLRLALIANRDWFEPWLRVVPGSWDVPPSSTLRDLSVDEEGLLWVLIRVPYEDWTSAYVPDRNATDPMGNPRLRPGVRYMDTILEVVDPKNGRVVTRVSYPYLWRGFAASGVMWRSGLDENARPWLEIASVELEGR